MKVIVIFQYAPVFSTQVHCAASSLGNERVRNLPRILLQERRRGEERRGRKGIRNRDLAFQNSTLLKPTLAFN